MKSNLVPLVDGDIIVYRCGLADASQTEPLNYTLHSVKQAVEGILEFFEPSERSKLFLQGKGNYRNHVATVLEYKGNRDPSKRPVYFEEIREYLVDYKDAEIVDGMETDDALGIMQWSNKDRSTCIVSIDKDLDMIPGWHYNYVKNELYYIDLPTANKKFWTQVLTGDLTDNILGCGKRVEKVYKSGKKIGQRYETRDGVGPQAAEAIIAKAAGSWEHMRDLVRKEYDKMFGEDAGRLFHENATLLWIQREEFVNYDGSVIHGEVSTGDSGSSDQDQDGQESPSVQECSTGSDAS